MSCSKSRAGFPHFPNSAESNCSFEATVQTDRTRATPEFYPIPSDEGVVTVFDNSDDLCPRFGRPSVEIVAGTCDAALCIDQDGWSRQIVVGDASIEAGGLVELADNNPMVCADIVGVPGPVATLALIALALTIVGTYGLSSYSVTERQREIGIRLALGAEPAWIIRMILRDGLGYALAGLAIGLPLAFLAARAVSSRLSGAGPADAFLFFVVAAVLLVTISAACWLPARRAAGVSPSEPLRAD